jgi:hypothetical protein
MKCDNEAQSYLNDVDARLEADLQQPIELGSQWEDVRHLVHFQSPVAILVEQMQKGIEQLTEA